MGSVTAKWPQKHRCGHFAAGLPAARASTRRRCDDARHAASCLPLADPPLGCQQRGYSQGSSISINALGGTRSPRARRWIVVSRGGNSGARFVGSGSPAPVSDRWHKRVVWLAVVEDRVPVWLACLR